MQILASITASLFSRKKLFSGCIVESVLPRYQILFGREFQLWLRSLNGSPMAEVGADCSCFRALTLFSNSRRLIRENDVREEFIHNRHSQENKEMIASSDADHTTLYNLINGFDPKQARVKRITTHNTRSTCNANDTGLCSSTLLAH